MPWTSRSTLRKTTLDALAWLFMMAAPEWLGQGAVGGTP
jgi:hypothetical protein